MYDPFDHYFNKAKKDWYKARSAFKLEAIQDKFHIFDKNVRTVIDIWCAPGSWLQYASSQLQKFAVKDPILLWFDIKAVKISLPNMYAYKQDITDHDAVQKILTKHELTQVDCIISDMAPNTIGVKDIDAIRSIDLLEKSLWMYQELLKKNGKFVTKIFMWPGFDVYVKRMKDVFGWKHIKIYKPDASRTNSKETYVIKV